MANKSIIVFIIMVIIAFSFIITIPITFMSIHFSLYDKLNDSLSYDYMPDSPSSIEKLYLNVDVGDIEIKYVSSPVDYYVKIDVNIEMGGANLVGKLYTDYFNAFLQNTSTSVNFTFEILPELNRNEVLSLIQNITLVVSIRSDIMLDIITVVKDGNFEVTVPFGVSIGSTITNITKGDIFYNFEYCIIDGNITGITKEGNLDIKSNNLEYTQNSNWTLDSKDGNMNIEIYQYKEIGANITGTAVIPNGNVKLVYKDNTVNVGAKFDFNYISGTPDDQTGFIVILWDSMFSYESLDFPAENNYSLLLNSTGFRTIDIVSQ
ncbi:MAG: hypothetical protein ACFFD5_10835 [Candidatus Thorarchaeota archaeon]